LKVFTTYLLLIAQVVIGLIVLIIFQQLKWASNANTISIFTFFLLLNLLYLRIFHLRTALQIYWSPHRLPLFVAGIVGGFVLVALPKIAAMIYYAAPISGAHIDHISAAAVIFTFLITGWEELWFRSLLLNHVVKYLKPVTISLTVGILFTLIHLLNPEIHLLKSGPMLFLAGTLLTALYFYYRTIWVPVGLHFANNFFSSITHTHYDGHSVFGSEGYVYTGMLLIAAIFFLWRIKNTILNS
jgi:membrane protease YdiL (CAAX protease family)